jgi:ubiquinone/menaquinone biosynthesis C-methylase UbiE
VADFAGEADFAVGVDASHDMLSVAKGKMAPSQRYALVVGHAQRLPVRDASFDVVISLHTLHLFRAADQRAMVSEMKRVTKPGGTLVLEFDNALQGLGLGLYKRWMLNTRSPLPRDIRAVIGNDFRLLRVHGAVFPVTWRLFHRLPAIFVPFEKIAYLPLVNRLAHRLYYLLQAPGQESPSARRQAT